MTCRYVIDQPLLPSVERVFRECGYVDDKKDNKYGFMNGYIINAVLSYIEKKEQDLVLGMRYNDWVTIDGQARKEIKEQIIRYINDFMTACGKARSSSTEDLMREIENNNVVEKSICYLYIFGIYGDCISRYLLIKPPNGDVGVPDYDVETVVSSGNLDPAVNAFNSCVEAVKKWDKFEVRSRFIEMVRDLYLLKQRFPDRPTFDSYMLVDRVFAYANPRRVPIGVYSVDETLNEWMPKLKEFFYAYRNYLTGNSPGAEKEWSIFWDVFSEFMRGAFGNNRLYKFQVRGIKEAVEKLKNLLLSPSERRDYNADYLVVTAPTGSGKTEIMVLTILIAALARKVILLVNGIDTKGNAPVAIMIYPRRALANDQVSRLIGYLYILNNILGKKLNIISPDQKITLTIDYADIRWRKEYEDAINELKNKPKERQKLKIEYGVPAYYDPVGNYIELGFLTCPNRLLGSSSTIYPRFKVNERNGSGKVIYQVDDSKVYCGDYELDFVALTKNQIHKRLGDIHITLFETLRERYLLNYRKYFDNLGLFGLCRYLRNSGIYDYPLIIALDEIHTYVDVPGVRYAFTLRRILNRIRYNYITNCGNARSSLGTLIIGLSATIPNAEDFLSNLFLSNKIRENVEKYLLKVSDEETIPLGSEYFIITVPTRRAPVDALTVSIQTIMDTFYNIPAIPTGKGHVKRGIVFMEELNVLRRMRYELRNERSGAIYRKPENSKGNSPYGLQDLRNPRSEYFRKRTVEDYGDDEQIIDEISRGKISNVTSTKSWHDGELWWGYMLDTILNHYKDREDKDKNNNRSKENIATTRFSNVAEYSSRLREDVNEANIVVSTSSLEVGVDYSDVVLIYQHGVPPNISALIQRAGRSGRRVFDFPLMRVIVGIQLSPDEPRQTWLFEIFTKVKNIKDALKYDKLFLPVKNKELHKQTAAELLLEYYILANKKVNLNDRWECELREWLNNKNNKEETVKYIQMVINDDKESLFDFIANIMDYLYDKCKREG